MVTEKRRPGQAPARRILSSTGRHLAVLLKQCNSNRHRSHSLPRRAAENQMKNEKTPN